MPRATIALLVCLLAGSLGCEPSPKSTPADSLPSPIASAADVGLSRQENEVEVEGPAASAAERPDVLLVIVDTLRADRLPAYGFGAGKTPTLSRLARDGVVFERALAASASTVPSHASLFTSRFVRQHAVGYSNGGTTLAGEATLAEQFRDGGYRTAGFISNVMLNRLMGLGRGFQVYDDRLPEAEVNRPEFFERAAPATTRRAIRWLERAGDEPVFLLVHYQDPHGPYTPPERVRKEITVPAAEDEPRLSVNLTQSGFGGLPAYQALEGLDRPSEYESRYVAEILYMDRWMGLLLDAFEKHRPTSDHVVLFTSDHGESMGEEGHWFAHGHTSMPDLARIPFVLRAPGVSPGRRSEPVSQVDILPTLVELAGLPVPEGVSGVALGPYLREARPVPDRPLYMDLGVETGVYDSNGMTRIQFRSLEAGEAGDTTEANVERYVWTEDGGLEEVEYPGTLSAVTTDYLTTVTPPRPFDHEPEPDRVEQLRALGYIEPEGAGDVSD